MGLTRVAFIAVPAGRKPGFDHADVSRSGRRMYVAHTGADRVDVLDCRAKRYLHALQDLPGVAGVLIDEEHDLLCTSDRGCARVSVFRCSTAATEAMAELALPGRPRWALYDPDRDVVNDPEFRRLHVAIGETGVVCTFDSDSLEPVETVETEAGAHTLGLDPVDHHLYVFCPGSGGAAVYAER